VWDTTDEALFAGYASGDPEAASMFVSRFQGKAVGLARLITRDAADAEEVAQDAFVRAWRYAASYDPRRGSVVGWFLAIVRTVALDRVRVSVRRQEDLTAELPAQAMIDLEDLGDAAGRSDDVARVFGSMRALPAEQRSALLAVTFLGLSAREYSEATGLPLGTAKTRIRLGLHKLRDELRERVERWP
jgi:RNA polymerase sigma-70 factor (ECF subfamily)